MFSPWIGFSNLNDEGSYEWVSGTESSQWQTWADGYPNLQYHCAFVGPDNLTYTVNCTETTHYIAKNIVSALIFIISAVY